MVWSKKEKGKGKLIALYPVTNIFSLIAKDLEKDTLIKFPENSKMVQRG